jgi:hypothetical protein
MRSGAWQRSVPGALLALALLAGCHGPRPDSGGAPDRAAPFANAAPAAGIRFVLGHSDHVLDLMESAGSGGAFVDYDADGYLDLLLIGENRCVMYRNTHDGKFEDVTASLGLAQPGHWIGCACADYDNDGYPDIFLNGYGIVRLLHNEGGKGFRDVTATSGLSLPKTHSPEPLFGTSAAWGDIDGDGWLDLYVARYVKFGPSSPRLCPGRSDPLTTCGPDHYSPQTGSLYRNLGGKRFADVTHASGADQVHGKAWGAMFSDLNDDGRQDLYVANDEMPGDLLENEGRLRLKNTGIQAGVAFDVDGRVHGGMGVDTGDYNGDGKLDLLVTTFTNEAVSLYRNNGDRTFTDIGVLVGIAQPTRSLVGWGTRLLDYDNDGLLDLMIVNGHATDSNRHPDVRSDCAQPLQLFRNTGPSFQQVPLGPLDAPIVGRGAAFGDYDNDGLTDALVIDMEGAALLLHNQAGAQGPRGHWLGLSLVGTRSNRQGLGARVTVKAGGKTWVTEARTCGSVFSSNDPRVRVGLGPAARVDEVIVHWPSGTVDRLTDAKVDKYQELTESGTQDGK